MATRVAKTVAAAAVSSIAACACKGSAKSTQAVAPLVMVGCHGIAVSKPRWFSSFPSLDYPPSLEAAQKTKKDRLNDRLSAVVDAVNYRKLLPELCGQRDSVRFHFLPPHLSLF